MRIQFWLEERVNRWRTKGKEWALNAQINDNSPWTVYAWEKKPNTKEVEIAKEIVLRSCEFYHRHIEWPKFNMEENK